MEHEIHIVDGIEMMDPSGPVVADPLAKLRSLRLDYYGLRNRVPRAKDADLGSDNGFVKLDLGASLVFPAEWRVEMEAPNGAKMILSLKGAPRDLDPLELSRTFWSQGR